MKRISGVKFNEYGADGSLDNNDFVWIITYYAFLVRLHLPRVIKSRISMGNSRLWFHVGYGASKTRSKAKKISLRAPLRLVAKINALYI